MSTTSSAARMRAWTGPAILSFGFRPFFLLAGLWAAAAMVLWVLMLTGRANLPTAFGAVQWHAHALLFGYLGAVMAGFLLTAVPNWTGRLPVTGWRLAWLAGLWALGQAAVAVSDLLPAAVAALADLAFPLTLTAFLGREVAAGRNWRNLPVLGLLLAWMAGLLAHHAALAWALDPGLGLRLGLAAAVMLIGLIGGRIVPSFTANWLAKAGSTARPVPFGHADAALLLGTLPVLALWVGAPLAPATGWALAAAGVAHLWRLSRWAGHRTGAEALVWVLHLAYLMVPLGFLALAAAVAELLPLTVAQHVWMAGAVGLMTLAVMTRASLGHAGRPLHAGPAVSALYVAVVVAVVARLAAGLAPQAFWLLHLAGGAWILAFGGFTVLYWPILTRARKKG